VGLVGCGSWTRTPKPRASEGSGGDGMTIRRRRWTIQLAAASLLLGSCSASATTDPDLDAADEEP
jgi:hypothetical protein